MEGRAAFFDDSGAVTSDWLVLTAGIALLGAVLTISVMENSSGYLMAELETLNEEYAGDSVRVSELERARAGQQAGSTGSVESN